MYIKNKFGFTLIELLVVIAIIGLLASMSTVVFNQLRKKARITKFQHNFRVIRDSLYRYYNDHGYFPDSTPCGNFCSSNHDDPWIPDFENYLPNIPYQNDSPQSQFLYRRCRLTTCSDDDQRASIYEIRMVVTGIGDVDCPEYCQTYSPFSETSCECIMVINCHNPSPTQPCL